MSRSLRRGVLAASLVLAVAPLSACAASNDATTLQVHPDNPEASVGSIQVQNAVVIVPADGGPDAVSVSAALVNNGGRAQTLKSVTVQGQSQPLKLAGPNGKGGITVPANGQVVLLGGKDQASATLPGAAARARKDLGSFEKVTFTFSSTGEVPVDASVVPAEGYYEPFGPSPQAASGAPSESASPSGSASPGESSKPGKPGSSAEPGSGESGSSTPSAPPSPNPSQSASG
ncbi:DUF461 domain-containing protein [Wenjunlia tyrosinilytica]|uniref:DUF461 domain-containing protein n=1 Tax=Wenjunlia tyrosinilytica TaxID=1544741 RepID=A0A918DW52_9ACTN|nr:DUF461 domain-containing protein [Wenjunlia tyrosinilytica]GGO87186.1 hypothetical protein GCM10012280_25090 [Wenjunlia tyrosinilytica]